MNIVAWCGSLRKESFNRKILEQLQSVVISDIPGRLPHFNPDLDPLPPEAMALHRELGAARGLIIATPEYAHGLPGFLKNALDWCVGCAQLWQLPVLPILVSAGPAAHASAQLLEILSTMDWRPHLPVAGHFGDADLLRRVVGSYRQFIVSLHQPESQEENRRAQAPL